MTHAEADLRCALAELDELAFEQRLPKLKKQFGVSTAYLRRLWSREHGAGKGGRAPSLAGRSIGELLKPAEPWPDSVDGAAWLEEATHELRRYLAMPSGGHEAVAAWNLYTFAWDLFGYAPYLIFSSPAPECGKSTALRACHRLCRLPLSTGSMTVATLFRVMDKHQPVLLCDEQDGRLERNEELKLLFNEGFQRGSYVLRCIGDDREERAFDPFGPKALCSIAALPQTIVSRSIVIPMERSAEPLEELGPLDFPETLTRLRSQAARWAQDRRDELGEIPEIPGMEGRLRDKAGPLLAVAACAGGGWLARIASAVQELHFADGEEAEHLVLIADVGRILDSLGWPSFIESASLVRQLNALPEAPWSELSREGLSAHKLAALLKHFRIRPEEEPQRLNGGERRRGYRTGPIRRAWETYGHGSHTCHGSTGDPAGEKFSGERSGGSTADFSGPGGQPDCDFRDNRAAEPEDAGRGYGGLDDLEGES